MSPLVRSSSIAAAIALVLGLFFGLIFGMGGGAVLFAIAMAAIGFIGTFVISSVIQSRKSP